MSEYKPIPVEALKRIADEYGKDVVLLIAEDHPADRTVLASFGKTAADKVRAAALLDDYASIRFGPDVKPVEVYEDFRLDAAKNKERLDSLEAAIRKHRDQKADDRCWMDDLELYAALGDQVVPDNRVGCPAEMLANCERFIARRCAGGEWPSYLALETELVGLRLIIKDLTKGISTWAAEEDGIPEHLVAPFELATGRKLEEKP